MIADVIAIIVAFVLSVVLILVFEWTIDIVKDLIRLIRGSKEEVVTGEECQTPFYGSDEMASEYQKVLNQNRGGSQNDSIKK
ncbi:hypothetical protein 0305phi8-36p045 [Bacillus phage 0305phi8-36]|uniref:hypothetical protein n=1 Tax=Bacillus phage 0305phi8-36 TaxID=458639 RepID=UPI00015A1F89|nr:hypothetical protein ST0305phi8-36p045 [Bacillus phage 0305phi8-36]ABS83606.1 hypothetical protein 0305phi8-36p045 [Bacillus phage 0305phi8-36]